MIIIIITTKQFYPIAIETAGIWDDMAIELVQEFGIRTTVITQDTRETVFLFRHLSIALQRGNAVSFLNRIIIIVLIISDSNSSQLDLCVQQNSFPFLLTCGCPAKRI